MPEIFTLLTRIALVVGAVLSLMAVSEVLDLYVSLQPQSPLAVVPTTT